MSRLEPMCFFPDSLISDVKGNPKVNYEKIKLEFSILHANKGFYSFQIKLYDSQVIDFNSEVKEITSMQKIVFDKFFVCDYYSKKQQNIQITINKNNNPKKIIKTTLDKIINSLQNTFIGNLEGDESLVIKAEKLPKDEDILNLKITLKSDLGPNFFIKNKLYYLVTCRNIDIYRSAEIMNNGVFVPSQIPTCLLQTSYTISFYNFNNKQIFNYNRTIQKVKSKEKCQIKVDFLNNKFLILEDNSTITRKHTLLDYLQAGVKIALTIGIDFSNSNNNSYNNGKLHSIQGNRLNYYERAITACAHIVGYYDFDQLFPVFGFGAIINNSYMNMNKPSMCFSLNFNNNPDIYTIDNVLKAYRDCINLNKITFSGPSFFAPLIREVIKRINKDDILEYHILMILTNGVINDLQQTIDVLVEASLLPLSVIIVGIGDGDFKNMEILDGDEVLLTSSTKKKRIRDIVQFVPFSKYQNDSEKLSMEVLAEIPRQIVEFYTIKNLRPEEIANLAKNNKGLKRSRTNPFPEIKNTNLNPNPNPMNIIINNTYQNINQVDIYNNNQNSMPPYQKSYTQGNDIYLKNSPYNNFGNNNNNYNNYQPYNNGLNNMNNPNNNFISFKNGSIVNNNNNINNNDKNINDINSKNYNQELGATMLNNIDFDNLPINETVKLDENNN